MPENATFSRSGHLQGIPSRHAIRRALLFSVRATHSCQHGDIKRRWHLRTYTITHVGCQIILQEELGTSSLLGYKRFSCICCPRSESSCSCLFSSPRKPRSSGSFSGKDKMPRSRWGRSYSGNSGGPVNTLGSMFRLLVFSFLFAFASIV